MNLDAISNGQTMVIEGNGDELAMPVTAEQFETEVRPHLQTLYRRALSLTGQQEAANDLVQDTFERGYRKRALFRRGTDLRAWLLCIMRNIWISTYRRRGIESNSVSLDELDEITLHRHLAAHDPGYSVVERLVVDGLGEITILNAIYTLPPRYRDVVVLVDVEGAEYKLAAESLGIPMGSVCSRLSRARAQIRRALLEQDRDVEGLARTG